MTETGIDVKKLLFEICEDPAVYDPDVDLVESGLMDSYAMIELFDALEDRGVLLQPTRVDRSLLRTAAGIEKLIAQQKAAEAEK